MEGDSFLLCKRASCSRVNRETMIKDNATMRTLRRALATIGSEERLAAALNCSPLDLVRWMSGEAPAPGEVFCAALDIVANIGPAYAQPRARRA
ncbi:MAG: hypothetical protein ABR570_17485 [Burkholderiales bacterium]